MSTPTPSVVKRSDVTTYSAPQKNNDRQVAKFAPEGARDVYLAGPVSRTVCHPKPASQTVRSTYRSLLLHGNAGDQVRALAGIRELNPWIYDRKGIEKRIGKRILKCNLWAVPLVKKATRSKNPKVRGAAARTLGQIDGKDRKLVERMLKDKKENVRIAAAVGLREFSYGDAASSIALLRAFNRAKSKNERETMVYALVATLIDVKLAKNLRVAKMLRRALPKIIASVDLTADSDEPWGATILAQCIRELKYKQGVKYLVKMIANPKTSRLMRSGIYRVVYENDFEKIAMTYLPQERSNLERILDDPKAHRQSKEIAATYLAWIGGKKGIPVLINALKSSDPDSTIGAYLALSSDKLGKSALPHLLRALKSATGEYAKEIKDVIDNIDPNALKPQKAPVIERPKS